VVDLAKKLRMFGLQRRTVVLRNATRMASRASVAERFGRNPKLQDRKSRSNIGSRRSCRLLQPLDRARWDAERPHPAVGLWDLHPADWCRAVDACTEVLLEFGNHAPNP